MGWLSSLLNLDKGKSQQVFSSTHDAFALPTSSPVPDAFNPDSPAVVSYTYPPQSPAAYGYVPSSSRPQTASLLPTHMDHLHTSASGILRASGSASSSPYPPLSKTWARIQMYLSREYPELGDTLNYGILPQDLAEVEMQFGFSLPSVVRESYLCVDGQEAESSAGCSEGLFFGLKLLPLETVLEEWRFWREVDHDPLTGANAQLLDSMQSIPPHWVRKAYSQRGWIPLIADKVGNYVGVDLNPGEQGQVGQVIVFGRDFDTKVVLWRGDGPTGWAKWLASFVEELESGEGFEIGNGDGASEDSEDELGYEGYFYDGTGRGAGAGGGDGGETGLRLTGEYKGWNVLEAWADRSLRKWHEAGIVTDADLVPIEQLSINGTKPGDLDIVEVGQANGTDIPIPVLNYSQERIPSPPPEMRQHQNSQSTQATLVAPALSASASTSTQSSMASTSNPHHQLPTISVTKPPAPLPVGLPTAHDIAVLPSPPESVHSLDQDNEMDIELSHHRPADLDLEAGRGTGLGLRNLPAAEDVGLVSATRKSKSRSPIRRDTSDAAPTSALLPPTPPSDDTADNAGSKQLKEAKEAVLVPLEADLLMDQVPVSTPVSVPMVPLEPSPSSAGVTPPTEEDKESSEEDDDDDEEDDEDEDDAQPEATIRLVGNSSSTAPETLKIEAPTPTSEVDVNVPSPEPSPSNTAETVPSTTDSRPGTPSMTESRPGTPSGKKLHKKNMSSLASNLGKRFSAGLGKKKDAKEKDLKEKEEKTA